MSASIFFKKELLEQEETKKQIRELLIQAEADLRYTKSYFFSFRPEREDLICELDKEIKLIEDEIKSLA